MARGEYIPKMQRQVGALNAVVIVAHQGLTDLIAHCNSDKFKDNEYINVKDVINWCHEVKSAMTDKEYEKLNEPLPVKVREVEPFA